MEKKRNFMKWTKNSNYRGMENKDEVDAVAIFAE